MSFKKLSFKKQEARICGFDESKEYAVLLPIVESKGESCILFEVRSDSLNKQPNEICLPGGRIEAKEEKAHAAIRETAEELDVEPTSVSVDIELDTLVTPFNTIIYPFVGTVENYTGSFNHTEVKEVFFVPLQFLLDTKPLIYSIDIAMKPGQDFPFELIQNGRDYPWGQGRYPVYFYIYKDKIIWGITARIIHNFIDRIEAFQ